MEFTKQKTEIAYKRIKKMFNLTGDQGNAK